MFGARQKHQKCINHVSHKTFSWGRKGIFWEIVQIAFSFDVSLEYTIPEQNTKSIHLPMASQISLFYLTTFLVWSTFWLRNLSKLDICSTFSFLNTCQSYASSYPSSHYQYLCRDTKPNTSSMIYIVNFPRVVLPVFNICGRTNYILFKKVYTFQHTPVE